jgi:predicted metal-binding protein
MSSQANEAVKTKRHVLGQLVVCKGCCCGQQNKGRPSIPEEKLKTIWKKERLMRTIQLTISGCVGPCDVANVVQIITPHGTEWFGQLTEEAHYDALIEWARACNTERILIPRPSILTALRFQGYILSVEMEMGAAKLSPLTPKDDIETRSGAT